MSRAFQSASARPAEKLPSNSADVSLQRAADRLSTFTSIDLKAPSDVCALGLGGESKAVFCLRAGTTALLSPVFDRLTDPACYRAYIDCVRNATSQPGLSPVLVAHDLHPHYVSTAYAVGCGLPRVAVQHHHAHIASVMADCGAEGPVVGICCDGIGLGTDGAAWGCEVLYCTGPAFERIGHLEYFPLVGGDAAAIENWRPAAALLRQAFGTDWRLHAPPAFKTVPADKLNAFDAALESHLNAPMTSSLGRVFDAASFLLGLCARNDREAQAAMALERAAAAGEASPYPYETVLVNGGIRMSMAPIVRAMIRDVASGESAARISLAFHESLARMLAESACMACEMASVSTVALSGGCFANRRLLERLIDRLDRRHVRVLTPRRVSFGDAGLALGQVHVAARLQETDPTCALPSRDR